MRSRYVKIVYYRDIKTNFVADSLTQKYFLEELPKGV